MEIKENISLKEFTTFQIGGRARYFSVAKNQTDLRDLLNFAKSRKLPVFILGGGSNLLILDHDFSGLVIKNEIKGIKFTDLSFESDQPKVILEVGAGEIWDDIVALSVKQNLFGLENLSGIPGTVGGAAVQNAGAYGVEIKDSLVSVMGLNLITGKEFVLKNVDCQYGYRDSFFKHNKKYIITSVTFKLSKKPVFNLTYTGLKDLASKEGIKAADIREAVLQIRGEKLPDWHKIPTAGSFFKNPIVTSDKFEELKQKFSEILGWSEPKGKVKVSLAWILDKICNFKGYREENVGLYDKQPLILVNYGGATAKEIIYFAEKIKKIVKEKVGIEIEEEVEKNI